MLLYDLIRSLCRLLTFRHCFSRVARKILLLRFLTILFTLRQLTLFQSVLCTTFLDILLSKPNVVYKDSVPRERCLHAVISFSIRHSFELRYLDLYPTTYDFLLPFGCRRLLGENLIPRRDLYLFLRFGYLAPLT